MRKFDPSFVVQVQPARPLRTWQRAVLIAAGLLLFWLAAAGLVAKLLQVLRVLP